MEELTDIGEKLKKRGIKRIHYKRIEIKDGRTNRKEQKNEKVKWKKKSQKKNKLEEEIAEEIKVKMY